MIVTSAITSTSAIVSAIASAIGSTAASAIGSTAAVRVGVSFAGQHEGDMPGRPGIPDVHQRREPIADEARKVPMHSAERIARAEPHQPHLV